MVHKYTKTSGGSIRKYLVFFNSYLKDTAAYKADVILSMVINIVYFFIYFIIWKAIYTGNGISQINNYTLSNTITYYLITTIFARADTADQIMLTDWIWYGELTKDLIKPWNVKLVQFIMFIGNTLYSLIMYIPFLIILFLLFHNYVNLPSSIYLFYFSITLILAILLGLVFFGILHSLTFIYGDQSSNINLVSYLVFGMSGGIFPLDFLPANISWIFLHLPFQFMLNTPAKVFLEKISPTDIFYSWGQMIIWIILFYLIFHFIFKNGLKHFTGVGR